MCMVDQKPMKTIRLGPTFGSNWQRGKVQMNTLTVELPVGGVPSLSELPDNFADDERFLLALKLAEADLLRERLGEPPLLLLDDPTTELDREGVTRLMQVLAAGAHQLFVATCGAEEIVWPSTRPICCFAVEEGVFRFWIDIPLALGTVGGLTGLHPMVRFSHELLGNPNAQELMQITAAVGLAQNFSALKSLVSSGIQKGHMKMHLLNILNGLGATEVQKEKAKVYFSDKVVAYAEVKAFVERLRGPRVPDPGLILLSPDSSSMES